MARTRRLRKADTWKTKKWVDIVAPKMFGEVKIGETCSSDPSNLIGRIIETTMRDIAGDFSKQHIQIRFKIIEVVGDTAHTKFVMHSLSRAYMRSQIRRKMTRVEGIQDIVTKDGYKLRVKSIALAAGRAQTAQEKLLRKLMNSMVKKHGSNNNFEVLIQEVVLGKLPSMIYRAANKVYPVRRVEIKKIRLLEEPRSVRARASKPLDVKIKETPKPKTSKIEKKEVIPEPPETKPAPDKAEKVKEEPKKKVEKEVKTVKKIEKKTEKPKKKPAVKKTKTTKVEPKKTPEKKTKPKAEKKKETKTPKEKKPTKAKSKKKTEKKK